MPAVELRSTSNAVIKASAVLRRTLLVVGNDRVCATVRRRGLQAETMPASRNPLVDSPSFSSNRANRIATDASDGRTLRLVAELPLRRSACALTKRPVKPGSMSQKLIAGGADDGRSASADD